MQRLKKISLFIFMLCSFSCAKLADVDKSMINHPALDLASDMTDSTSSAFTTLSGNGGGAAGCAT